MNEIVNHCIFRKMGENCQNFTPQLLQNVTVANLEDFLDLESFLPYLLP